MGIWDSIRSAAEAIAGEAVDAAAPYLSEGWKNAFNIAGAASGSAIRTGQATAVRMVDLEGWERTGRFGLRVADKAITLSILPYTIYNAVQEERRRIAEKQKKMLLEIEALQEKEKILKKQNDEMEKQLAEIMKTTSIEDLLEEIKSSSPNQNELEEMKSMRAIRDMLEEIKKKNSDQNKLEEIKNNSSNQNTEKRPKSGD